MIRDQLVARRFERAEPLICRIERALALFFYPVRAAPAFTRK
jgi:hypothetical protein